MRTLTFQKPLFLFLILVSVAVNADMYEPATLKAEDLIVDYPAEGLNREVDQESDLDGSVSFKIDNSKIKQSTSPDAGVSNRLDKWMDFMSNFTQEETLANILIQPHIQECLRGPGSPDAQLLITSAILKGSKSEIIYEFEVTSRVMGDHLVFAGTRFYEVYMRAGENDFQQAGCDLLVNHEMGK